MLLYRGSVARFHTAYDSHNSTYPAPTDSALAGPLLNSTHWDLRTFVSLAAGVVPHLPSRLCGGFSSGSPDPYPPTSRSRHMPLIQTLRATSFYTILNVVPVGWWLHVFKCNRSSFREVARAPLCAPSPAFLYYSSNSYILGIAPPLDEFKQSLVSLAMALLANFLISSCTLLLGWDSWELR